jgi:hypothetical protein
MQLTSIIGKEVRTSPTYCWVQKSWIYPDTKWKNPRRMNETVQSGTSGIFVVLILIYKDLVSDVRL